jgi:putative ABC transport system permease protein
MGKLGNLLGRRRDRLERDLDRELRYHIDRRVDDLLKDGVSEPDARRRASLEFGGVPQVQEAVRDTWIWRGLDALMRDVRFGTRSLIKTPGFTMGAATVLALAIGATTAVFSVVNGVLLQPLPYPDANRMVSIETFWTNDGRTSQDVSGPDFLDWQAHNDVFEAMAVSYGDDNDSVVVGDGAVFAKSRNVSADFFAVFGQTPSAGRLLTEQDIPAGDGAARVAVVAHHWALAHFGSADDAIGKSITVYDSVMEIVGVATQGFRFPSAADLWLPSRPTDAESNRSDHPYQAVGKLKRDVTLPQALAQMRIIGDTIAQQHPENRLKTVTVVPLQDRLTGNLHTTLWVLLTAVGVVWLIGCANITNLLLARGASRTREIALRAALGAGRGRVLRQLLTESCVLAGVAGLAGLLLAFTLIQGLSAVAPAGLPRIDEVRMDMTVLLFSLGLSLSSTVLFGLVPAWQGSRGLSDALKQGGSKATGTQTSARLRSTLVVAEIALSLMLLVTAGLLLRSYQALQNVDLGFSKDQVLVADTVYPVRDDVREDIWVRSRFYEDVLDRLRKVPGVSAASGVAYLGMGREPRSPRDFFIQGRPVARPGERPQAEYHAITPGYFKTLEIPLRAGRDFNRTDTPEQPPVAIVNETLARTAFPGESPLGQRIRTGTSPSAPLMEIVGVVGDTRWQDPSRAGRAVIYAASTQGAGNSLSILTRASLDDESLAGTLRAIMRDVNPTIPVRFDRMDALVDSTLTYPRFRAQVIGLFAGMAAVLAVVGIFSVLAYLVGQRTRELAIRRALGASTADVIRLVAGQGVRLVAAGLALGLLGSFAMARLLAGLLYELGPRDVSTYMWTVVVLAGAAVLAMLVPAVRAATVAPSVVLQQE